MNGGIVNKQDSHSTSILEDLTEPDPPVQADVVVRTRDFIQELERDSWLQAERHVTASGFWRTYQWVVGGMSAVFAAIAAGTAFADYQNYAGIAALVAAATAALATALRPGDLSAQHLQSATWYHSLQLAARDAWEFDRPSDPEESRKQLRELADRWADITSQSPRVPRRLYRISSRYADKKGANYFPKPRLATGR
jgi:hypothetical protein